MEKEQYFAADHVKGYGFKKWTRDCSWQWHVTDAPWPFKRKHKKNSGSLLTGRKHTKIVRLGDGCLNWETPDKSGRLDTYAKEIYYYLDFFSFLT